MFTVNYSRKPEREFKVEPGEKELVYRNSRSGLGKQDCCARAHRAGIPALLVLGIPVSINPDNVLIAAGF